MNSRDNAIAALLLAFDTLGNSMGRCARPWVLLSVNPAQWIRRIQVLAMTPRDRAIIRYLKSRQGIIVTSLALTVGGIIFIILTGRYELSWFVAATILPWVEYWLRRKKK